MLNELYGFMCGASRLRLRLLAGVATTLCLQICNGLVFACFYSLLQLGLLFKL